MDKIAIKESILRIIDQEVDTWLEEEPKIKDPFEYEKQLFERAMRIGKVILEQGQGKVSKDRNLKKKY